MASLSWTGVGTGLWITGVHWIWPADRLYWFLLLPAMIAGWAKGYWILRPRAEANASRILNTAEARCIGGFFTWASWGIAVVMVLIGITLRHSSMPRPWLGILYSAIGTALATASVSSWRQWCQLGV